VDELGFATGPLCGAALFVALAGGRLPHARVSARPGALALRWLSLGALAGLEELVWRGLALAALALALGSAAALVLSSVGFAVWHAPALGRRCAIHTVTGLSFGSAFLVGGIAAAVLAHAIYNVLVDWAVQVERGAS
jgi:membrane protease YdiL (CAAX protease family)